MKRTITLVAVVLLTAVHGIKIPKPTYSLDFGSSGQLEFNSDTSRTRKPPYAYVFSLNGSVGWTVFSAGLNLCYNSDDKFTAQRVHQFSFNPTWKWGRIYLGDFSTTLSPYTYAGLPLYGAGVELSPGIFRFAAIAGRAKRTSTDVLDWSYRRNLYAVKLGVEQCALTVMKVKDDTLSNRTDSSVVIPPQENLAASLNSRFKLGPLVSVELEGAGSIHTRDLRSDVLESKEVPAWVYRIYEPRWSSRIDYALKGSVRYSPKVMTLGISAGNVGPGYTSLGTSYLKNDCRNVRLDVSTSAIPRTNLGCVLERGWDNLAGDKLATTTSDILGGNLSVTPISQLSISANYSRNSMVKNAESDSFSVNSVMQMLSLMPNLNLAIRKVNQNLSLMATYQDYANRIALSSTPPSKSLMLGLNYSITLPLSITLASGISRTMNLADTPEWASAWYQNYSLSGSRAFFNDKLQNSLTLSFQPSELGDNFAVSGTNSFAFTRKDVVNLNWSLNWYVGAPNGIRSFSAQRASLSYNRKLF